MRRSLEGMPSTTTTRSLPASRVIAAIIAALLAAASILFFSPAAHAHDELLGSEPAAGATVDAWPDALALTFSGAISQEDGASEIQVTDATGADLTAGEPEIQDNVLTQPVTGTGSGEVTVLWKVVSSDGHPISGEYAFTVSAPEPTATATPTAEPTEEPTAEPTETAVASPTATPAPTDGDVDENSPWPWIIGIVVGLGLGAAIIYLVISRARQKKALADSRTPTER